MIGKVYVNESNKQLFLEMDADFRLKTVVARVDWNEFLISAFPFPLVALYKSVSERASELYMNVEKSSFY